MNNPFKTTLFAIALVGSLAYAKAPGLLGSRFGAPEISDHNAILSPEVGDIVLDTADGNFWGRAADTGTPTGFWIPLGGASTAVPTGSILPYVGSSAPTGYLLASGQTIGGASSGGTARANADTEDLFTLLWNGWSNTELPIQDSSGSATARGASAAADFAANKRLPLPDLRGRVAVGRDDMGGSTAGRMTSGGSGIAGTTMGASGGAQTHTLSISEMPSHNHTVPAASTATSFGVGDIAEGNTSSNVTRNSSSTGGGGAHNNTQPSLVLNYIIKL